MTQKILLTGADGQLGYELQRSKPDHIELLATDVADLDITDWEKVEAYCKEHQPDLIINAAAYTAVDKAEEDKELAFAINQLGAKNLATAAKNLDARMLQISTDFVFSDKKSSPYLPYDDPEPVSVYGESKLAGENEVLTTLGQKGLVIRTAWLYSAHGNNFVKTMLKFMNDRDELGIVADQIGTPTWAATLADTVWQLTSTDTYGILHCADNGVASWYDFAVAIHETGIAKGLIKKPIAINAIRTQDYPTPATRPTYSVMDKTKTEQLLDKKLPHWQTSLQQMLNEL